MSENVKKNLCILRNANEEEWSQQFASIISDLYTHDLLLTYVMQHIKGGRELCSYGLSEK